MYIVLAHPTLLVPLRFLFTYICPISVYLLCSMVHVRILELAVIAQSLPILLRLTDLVKLFHVFFILCC